MTDKLAKRGMTNKKRDALCGYLFFLPWIVGFLVFTLYPAIFSVRMSFNEVTVKPEGILLNWQGTEYYDYALNVDTVFKLQLGNALLFICCSLPVVLVFSLIIALLLNKDFKGRTFFRIIFFIPVIIMSGPVVSNLISGHSLDFSEYLPSVYAFLQAMPSFISKPSVFILDELVLILWFSGVPILIFMVGLQRISPDIYEAADIDGAGGWEKFWKITLPHLTPMILLSAIYTVVETSNYSELDINKKITGSMFDTTKLYSFSAAMSWIYFCAVIAVLLVVFLISVWLGRRSQR
ncbi:MAG TPA: sugar ABC transporter permease [Ruminococcaceae bacterium]|nr:sugar ABC transporter permease [Oscillospiraceae bacterium]